MEQAGSFRQRRNALKDDKGPEFGAAACAASGSTLKVVINGKIEATIDVLRYYGVQVLYDLWILDDLRLLIPITTQTLTTAITFTLGGNSEVTCHEIAYMDMVVQT